jgi:hypothetical protein
VGREEGNGGGVGVAVHRGLPTPQAPHPP